MSEFQRLPAFLLCEDLSGAEVREINLSLGKPNNWSKGFGALSGNLEVTLVAKHKKTDKWVDCQAWQVFKFVFLDVVDLEFNLLRDFYGVLRNSSGFWRNGNGPIKFALGGYLNDGLEIDRDFILLCREVKIFSLESEFEPKFLWGISAND